MSYDITYVQSKQKNTRQLIYKIEMTLADIDDKLMVTKGEVEEG